jgi:ABC-2 type transport system permease protein
MRLIKVEHLKILYKKRTYLIFGGIIIAALLGGFMEKAWVMDSGTKENFIGLLKSNSDHLSILQLFIIPIAGTIVSSEFEQGTATFLFIRPANRSKILLSKYITILLFGLYLIVTYLIISFAIGIALLGFTDMGAINGLIHKITINYANCLVEVLMISTLAFAISTIFNNSGLAIGTTLLLLFGGNTIMQLLSSYKLEFGKYLVFANTDLGQYFGGKPPFHGMSLLFSLIMLIIYLAVYLGSSSIFFLRKDILD